ncbi:MAG: cell division protein CrgA, partial [Clostridia bacterium]|nr:cell division protein CrgA [Clostridia bacterium]
MGSTAITGCAPAARSSLTASIPSTPSPITIALSPSSRRHLRIAASGKQQAKTNRRWFVPTFIALLVIGLAWVVTNYITAG